MKAPTFDPMQKYRCLQSSMNGSIDIQDGNVFDEGHTYIGPAPQWGPDLFVENGQPIDPHAKVLAYARAHAAAPKEASVDDVFDGELSSKPKRGRPAKVKEDDVSGDGSGAL